MRGACAGHRHDEQGHSQTGTGGNFNDFALSGLKPEVVCELINDAENIADLGDDHDSLFRRKLRVWARQQAREMEAHLKLRGHVFPMSNKKPL